MEKKPLFLTFLVLSALFLTQVCFADVNGPLRTSQEQITLLIEAHKTMSLINSDDFVGVNTAIEQMKTKFASNAELPRWLYKIAYEYERVGDFEQAKSLNAQVAADFPNNVYKTNAELQIAKLKIYELIDAGDYKAADSAISQIVVDFANTNFYDDENLPRRLWEVANRFDKNEAYEHAKRLCGQIIADYPKDGYARYASLLLARYSAYDLIAAGDYEAADAIASKIMNDFPRHKQIARRLWEIANRFDKLKAYKCSKTLCEKIVADYPDDTYAGYAGLQLAKLTVYELIDKGDYASADSAVCEAIQNFASQKQFSRRLYEIARQYAKNGALSYAKPLYGWLAEGFPEDKYGLRAASDYRALVDSVPDTGVSKVAEIAAAKTNLNPTAKLTDVSAIEAFASDISSKIVSGEPESVKTAIGMLIADFDDSSGLFDVLSGIIGICYKDNKDNLPSSRLLRVITDELENYVKASGDASILVSAYQKAATVNYRLGDVGETLEFAEKALYANPRHKWAVNMQWLIADCYEKIKALQWLPAADADVMIEGAYQDLLTNYPDRSLAEYAAIQLGNLCLKQNRDIEACAYYGWFLVNADSGDCRVAGINNTIAEKCRRNNDGQR